MHPILFTIPGLDLPVRAFGVTIVLAFLLAHRVWMHLLARYGADPKLDPQRSWDVGMWILVGVIAGGRLMYVVVEVLRYLSDQTGAGSVGQRFVEQPWRVFFVWEGGLVMYGGFAGAVLLGLWGASRAGMQLLPALDTGLVAGFVGQALGRVGCLLVGDDYGRVVPERWQHLPFPITLRVPDAAWLRANPASLFEPELAGQLVWCTQVWMSVSALIVALVGWLVLRRRSYAGQASLVVLLVYAVNRFVIEAFRGDSVRGLWFGGALSTSQLVSIPVALLALVLLLRNARRSAA